MNFRMDLIERKIIQDLLDSGSQIKDIADILKRSKSAISSEIKKNGGIRLYNAERAQELSDLKKIESNKGKNSPLQHLIKRVNILEEMIKKLADKDTHQP